MGGIWASREYFRDAFIEIAGYKAGVIVSETKLLEIMKDFGSVGEILDPGGPGGGRIHSVEFEDAVAYLLFKIGNLPNPRRVPITIEMFHRYRATDKFEMYQEVMQAYISFMEKVFGSGSPEGAIDPSQLMLDMFRRFGTDGSGMVLELIRGVNRDLHRSPWGKIRSTEWRDIVELENLFNSADLKTQHGRFLDQRFIDYLSANFDEIDRMHWRKFEGFAGEFFDREGYAVVLGPGSNDDGVDLRVYPRDTDPNSAPMIIVQCKRQKAKIEKALVKSIYADVIHEGANSGLIVTTSTLSPGAEKTRNARSYPVEAADRATIRAWIDKLKTGAEYYKHTNLDYRPRLMFPLSTSHS